MRVLHVSDVFLPRPGGIELHVHDLASRQRATGAKVSVVTTTAGVSGGGDDVVRLPPLAGFPHPLALAELSRLITSRQFDVVHAHSSLFSPLAWSAVRVAAQSATPAVLTMHSMVPPGSLGRAWAAAGPRLSTNVVCTSVSVAAAASMQRAISSASVTVLPNGIEPAEWAPRSVRAADRSLTLVSVMRTARRKRPLPLLEIFRAIRQQVPSDVPLRAVLVGSGRLDEAISRQLRRTGMDTWVSQAGQRSRVEIRELLHQSDLYLAPATLESFGIAALEARCAGVPVIGMAGGGVADFISDGAEGFLVGSDAAMATRAAQLLTHPTELEQMKRHNRTRSPVITWSRVLQMHENSYREATARARRNQAVWDGAVPEDCTRAAPAPVEASGGGRTDGLDLAVVPAFGGHDDMVKGVQVRP